MTQIVVRAPLMCPPSELVSDIFRADLVWTNNDIKDFSVVRTPSPPLTAVHSHPVHLVASFGWDLG